MSGSVAAVMAALPDSRHEDWRYTDLAPLKARAWIEEKGSDPFSVSFEDDQPLTRVVKLGERADGARLLAHRIALRRGQQATLVLHELGADVSCLALHNIEVELAENAHLTLYRVQ